MVNSAPYPALVRQHRQTQTRSSFPICSICNKRHLGKCLLGQRGCYCNDPGHLKRDCPWLGQAQGKAPATQAA
ncbi:hypothetical protein KY289_016581 [Solanum tuberosum]|nr:hypothetical protein KY289_016581 [Solanum tuberosum]